MIRRFIAVTLALFLLIPALMVPSYATDPDPDPVATIVNDLPETPEVLYMGTGDAWEYTVQLKFANEVTDGTVTYQWYRAEGEYPDDEDFEEHFDPDPRVDSYISGDAITTDNFTFTTPNFYRDLSEAGTYTYCVVFTYNVGSSTQTFKSTQRVTYVAPQVLFAKSQTDVSSPFCYFEGAPASELSVTLGLPDNQDEAAPENYGTIKYQWYKSSVASSPFVYDDFPFFDEDETVAISGASGVIEYADASDADGTTITYTPVNDAVSDGAEGGMFHYWPLVYVEKNGVISYTPNILDALVQVLPSPVASLTRSASSATVNLAVTLPEGSTVQSEYQYLLVAQGDDPGATPTYNTAELDSNAKAVLSFADLRYGSYDLYLVFTDDAGRQWPYKASIPRYSRSSGSQDSATANPIDASTTDGSVKGQGTMTTTATEAGVTTTVNITGKSFNDMVAQTANGVGLQINTPNAKIIFDETAALHIVDLADSRDVVLSVSLADHSALSGEIREAVGDRPVYDFTVAAGGTQVSSFEGGSATISIPYTLSPGEQPEAVMIYYIDDTGSLIPVRGAYNAATGMVDFTAKHFSYYAVGYNLVSFNDVTADNWCYKAATFIAARGITTGVGGGLFAPDAAITRGEFITMLLRAYAIAPDTASSDNFSDAGNTYYTNYLAAAKRLGIAKGSGGNLFAPDSSISRQDMFTLLYRALDVLGALPEAAGTADFSAYTDSDAVADYARDAFKSLIAGNVVTGSGGQLRPAGTATRAEMATILYRLLSA